MIFNVAFNAAYNWDGGVRTLEAHAERVLLSPALMHATWPELLAELQRVPSYRAAFTALYPGHLTSDHVLDALVTYERSLVTPNAVCRATRSVGTAASGSPDARAVSRSDHSANG